MTLGPRTFGNYPKPLGQLTLARSDFYNPHGADFTYVSAKGNNVMQTKLIITTAVLLGLAAPAHAQLFTPGGTYNFNIANSPGTSNNAVTFTPGTQLIDGGDVALTLTIVNAADFATTGAQWVVLQTQTVGNVPLSLVDQRGWPSRRHPDQLHCRLQPVDRHQWGEHPAG